MTNVFGTDEFKFEFFRCKRRVYVKKKRSPDEDWMINVFPTVEHCGASLMLCRCFGGDRNGDLIQVKGITKRKKKEKNKEQYHSI